MANIMILFSWKPMPFYYHVAVYTLSHKLKFSSFAVASMPRILVGLIKTGSEWHLSIIVPKCCIHMIELQCLNM